MSTSPDRLAHQRRFYTKSLFIGPAGLRSGWRLLLFFILALMVVALVQFITIRFIPRAGALLVGTGRQGGELLPGGLIALEVTDLIATFLALLVMSRIERRQIADYGFRTRSKDAVSRFTEGLVWGLAMVLAICFLLKLEGHFSLGPVALSVPLAVRYGLLWALGTLMVGFFEETVFRGYAQFTLSSGIGFWPAAFLLSTIFGAIHLGDHGYTKLGLVTAALFGLLSCFSLRRTGSLWLGIGFHAAFDFSEMFLFSPPNGGLANISTHLFSSSISGPSWLTGGGTGVEGSLNGLLIFAVVFWLFNRMHPPVRSAGMEMTSS